MVTLTSGDLLAARSCPEKYLAAGSTQFTVTTTDGPVMLHGPRLLFNAILWRPLLTRNLPIEKRHVIAQDLVTNRSIEVVHDAIVDDIIRLCPPDERWIVYREILEDKNLLFNVSALHLGNYAATYSAADLVTTISQPAVRSVIYTDLSTAKVGGVNSLEKAIDGIFTTTTKTFSDPTVTDNCLYPYMSLGLISAQQSPQVMAICGMRTDINELTIPVAIESSYFAGMVTLSDVVIDSRSALKSEFYNKQSMKRAQYTNRREQLMSCAVSRLYPGDCGSTVYTNVTIPDNSRIATAYLGMNIVLSDGTMQRITTETLHRMMGQVVRMRMPWTCRHTDGFCKACGGLMAEYMLPKSNPGILSVQQSQSEVGQGILSNKHYSRTTSATYILPSELSAHMRLSRDNIYWVDPSIGKRRELAVPLSDFPNINDVEHLASMDDSHRVNASRFSNVRRLVVRDGPTGTMVTHDVLMTNGDDGTVPHFTQDVVTYLSTNPDMYTIENDVVWIKFEKFDTTLPIMRVIALNDSMVRYASRVESFFIRDIARFTSLDEAFHAASSLLFVKVLPHVIHIATLLRSAMVTSRYNYEIPVVTDPNAVMFRPLGEIIPNRSLGAMLIYERLMTETLSNPNSFIIPKPLGPFDCLLFNDNAA